MAWEILLSGVCFLFIASISQSLPMTTTKPPTLSGTTHLTTAESDAKTETTTDRSADSLGDTETETKRPSQYSDSKNLSFDNNTTTNTNGLENTTSVTSVEIRIGPTASDQTSTSLTKDFPSTNAETGKPQIVPNVIDNVTSNATTHLEHVGTTVMLSSNRGVQLSEAIAAIGTPRSSGATSSIDASRPLSDRMSTDTDGTIPATAAVLSGGTALDDLDSGVTDAVSSANSHGTEPVNIDTSRKPFVNSTNAQHAAITTGSKTATGKENPVGSANTPTEVPLPNTTDGRQESQPAEPAISGTVRGGSSALHFSENGYSFLKMVLPLFLLTYIY